MVLKSLPYTCALCNCTLHSQISIKQHEASKTHRQVLRFENMVTNAHKRLGIVRPDPLISIGAAFQGTYMASNENPCSSSNDDGKGSTNMQIKESICDQGVLHSDAIKEKNECSSSSVDVDINKSDVKVKSEPLEQGIKGFGMKKTKHRYIDYSIKYGHLIVYSQSGRPKCSVCKTFLHSKCGKKTHFEGKRHRITLKLQRFSKEREAEEENRKSGGGKRKKYINMNRELKLKRQLVCRQYSTSKSKLKPSIIIKDFPQSLTREKILKHFKKYGRVRNYFFRDDNLYAIIKFCNYKSGNKVLGNDVMLDGTKLEIQSANYSNDETVLMNFLDLEKINGSLKDLPDFQTQLNKLIEQVQPKWLTEKCKLLCTDLQNILQEIFPGCAVFPFGAAETGLGFTTSVVDIHVEVLQEVAGTSNETQNEKETNSFCKSIEFLRSQKLVFLVTSADNKDCKVQCVHIPTQQKCDLYFTKWMSVRNSSLIRYYLSLDIKLKPLMIIIKYWGKVHELIGTQTPNTFSSYSLTLLLVFYLQQSPYLLPSVATLQASRGPVKTKGFWNTEFVAVEHFNSEAISNDSIPEILDGFFKYYANFDYLLNVICLYLGRPIPKTDFLNPKFLKINFPRNKLENLNTMSSIYVQDPFKHNDNVTALLPASFLKKFISLCNAGTRIFENQPSVDHPALYRLVTNAERRWNPRKKYACSPTTVQFPIYMHSNLGYISLEINKNNNFCLDPQVKLLQARKVWHNLVHKFIFAILTDLMKFTVNVEDDCPEIKSQRLNNWTDVHDMNMFSVTFQCSRSGTYDMRNAKEEGIILKGIDLDYQRELINRMRIPKFILMDLTLNINIQANSTEIVVTLTQVYGEQVHFKLFGNFFAKNVPRWVEEYIKELDNTSWLKNKKSKEFQGDESREEAYGKPLQIKSETKVFESNGNENIKCENFMQLKTEPLDLLNNETEDQTFEKLVQIKFEPEDFQNKIDTQIKSEPTVTEVQTVEESMVSNSECEQLLNNRSQDQ